MIYLRLAPQEAIDVLRVLVESGEKRISSRLEAELVDTLESLDKLERDRSISHAQAWLTRQQAIVNSMEKK